MIQHNANGMKFLLVEAPEIKGEFDILFTPPTMDMANPIYLVDKVGGGRTIICKLGEQKDFNGELAILGIASELTKEQKQEYPDAFDVFDVEYICHSHNLDLNRTLVIKVK